MGARRRSWAPLAWTVAQKNTAYFLGFWPRAGNSDPGRAGAGFEAESKPTLIEKVDVENENILCRSVPVEFRDHPYVKSWVCLGHFLRFFGTHAFCLGITHKALWVPPEG